MFVLKYQALARGFLDAQIFAEQALLVRLLVIALRRLFLRWLIGNGTGSPNLTVRMRIAGAHHGAAVLENLYVVDEVAASEIGELLAPHFDDCDDFFLVHARKGQIVAGGKASDAADAWFRLRNKQLALLSVCFYRVGTKRRVIVVEDEDGGIRRIAFAAGTSIARTKITVWIVSRLGARECGFDLTLPGALRAMRGHQDPLAGEDIQAAMGGVGRGRYYFGHELNLFWATLSL